VKKNIVGHMMAEKETITSRIRRWNIIPKLLCLILALLIWLTVVNLDGKNDNMQNGTSETDTEWVA